MCDSSEVCKIPSACFVSVEKSQRSAESNVAIRKSAKIGQFAKELGAYITRNTEDVGIQFAEEAKKMHHGEVTEWNIRGSATQDEVASLKDEGITILPLPSTKINKKI